MTHILLGTWKVMVTFEEGPQQGQVEETRVIFAPDHVFLIVSPTPGAGSWEHGPSREISFRFTELLYDAAGTCTGYVRVRQEGILEERSFVAGGEGIVYRMDGARIAGGKTTTQGVREDYLE